MRRCVVHVNVLLKNDIDRKRLFEAVKDTYVPAWTHHWAGRTDFERGFSSGSYPYRASMNIDKKTYCGVYESEGPAITVEEFINTYIGLGNIGEL